MPMFQYTAATATGAEENGTKEAESPEALARILRGRGLLLTSAVGASVKKGRRDTLATFVDRLRGVSVVERLLFTRNLVVMVAAGLPLDRALSVLARQSQHQMFRDIIADVEQGIRRGESFSAALRRFPDVFDEFYVSMIEVGEAGGSLVEVLRVLAHHLERTHAVRSKILGALLYPSVIIGVMVLIGIVMMVMVVPKLIEVFEDLDVDLPVTTQIVVGLSRALTEYALVVVAAPIAAIVGVRYALRQVPVRRRVHGWTLSLPVVRSLVQRVNVGRFARNISSLLTSGVPILRGMEITARTLGNIHYREAVLAARDRVQKGDSLNKALTPASALFPLLVLQMIEVGEETGELTAILGDLAEFYEDEVTKATENLTSVIEPVLMVVIGGVVGFFAISMIQPMYSMLGQI